MAAFGSQVFCLFPLPTAPVAALQIDFLSAATSSVALLFLGIVSFFEHHRAIRTSWSPLLYLLCSLLGDVLFLTSPEPSFQEQVTTWVVARLALLKAVLIFLESGNKESILMLHCRELPPEQLAGNFGKTFFAWIYPILRKGYTDILTPQDIPGLEGKLSSGRLRRDILQAWDQRRECLRYRTESRMLIPI